MQMTSTRKTKQTQPVGHELKLAHSPDSDDAFMFYALATKKIRGRGVELRHVLEDIESLNQKALEEVYDITAISFHAYAYLSDRYLLLPSGGSFGEGYGPIVVARERLGPEGLKGKRVAVPGKMTSAYLALRLYEPEIEPLETPFDQIFDRVQKGDAEAGVVIHEGQLTYGRAGLTKVVDLGEDWLQRTGLPLPLGGNAIRRSLNRGLIQEVAKLLRASIRYALDHREEVLAYALQFARGLDPSAVDRFVSMYVNERTLDCGDTGRQAVQTLLDRGFDQGLIPRKVNVEFVE
jgi:1,4-dihydroxy-6-naphthoate synthase